MPALDRGGNIHGVGLSLSNSTSVTVDNVNTSGFQVAGLEFSGCSSLRITRVIAHDNGYAGISSDGGEGEGYTPGGVSSNVYIGYCSADRNGGDPTFLASNVGSYNGSGIVLFQLQGATIEYCEASRNGGFAPDTGPGGPLGIWAADSDRLVFQHDISHDNHGAANADGGGFDLDGHVTNSVIQYSLSYHNDGTGFGFFQYQGAGTWSNNICRYNISIDNAQA